MQIIEYKKHLKNKELINPEWVIDGNHFHSHLDNTYIAKVPDEDVREYYIPDGLVVLTIEELKTRVRIIGITGFDGYQKLILSEVDIDKIVDAWLEE
jgi:hypothetical protein